MLIALLATTSNSLVSVFGCYYFYVIKTDPQSNYALLLLMRQERRVGERYPLPVRNNKATHPASRKRCPPMEVRLVGSGDTSL